MLEYLAGEFVDRFAVLNLFRYITFRTGGATITAMLVVFLAGPWIIKHLKVRQGRGQPIRDDGPISHIVGKQGTPTMGGLMILLGVCVAVLLWASFENIYVWLVLFVTLAFGLVGFYDDYLKITKASTRGFPGIVRLAVEFAVAGLAVWGFMQFAAEPLADSLALPFVKDFLINLGWFFLPFGAVVIVGAANAVNLTDGLDGLAIGPVMIAVASFGFIAYLVGHTGFADYLQVHFVQRSAELSVICGAVIGAGLGFLWFNAPPAMIFMGDTGSLSLGGALGAIAVATKHELVLAIIGGLFVLEAVSVIVQVASYKLTGKRVFRMAPLHHHFEQMGWREPTIVIRFWIIAIILAMAGLATLKLR